MLRLMGCPVCRVGVLRPYVIVGGLLILCCDEQNEIWFHPTDVSPDFFFMPGPPSRQMDEGSLLAPPIRYASRADLPVSWRGFDWREELVRSENGRDSRINGSDVPRSTWAEKSQETSPTGSRVYGQEAESGVRRPVGTAPDAAVVAAGDVVALGSGAGVAGDDVRVFDCCFRCAPRARRSCEAVPRWGVGVAGVAVFLLSTAGCALQGVDPETLPGEYVAVDGQGGLTLRPDGGFAAVDLPVEVLGDVADAEAVDLAGSWEILDMSGSDVVYLSVDEVAGGTSRVGGVQLYVAPSGSVYFHPDPDSGHKVVYERAE